MQRFSYRTGLQGGATSKRYLWTDAFAVCNFLALERLDLALELVERVHRELGQHRSDDDRGGWIGGLAQGEGERHPTLGGLRIGKPRPERELGQALIEQAEWDRDGQYFHYLTKWMHALDRVARTTGEDRYARWARELADTAHRRFSYGPSADRRMYWKMSIDLMRPQVSSMGHHDALDGYVTALQLDRGTDPDLDDAIADYRAMIDPRTLPTIDPLGLGGLLVDAYRLAQLDRDRPLRDALVAAATLGLEHYARSGPRGPADRRLAFRELGLAIGLAAAEAMRSTGLVRYLPLRTSIESFWRDAGHRAAQSWADHEDINTVMLATSLEPRGYLVLEPAPRLASASNG